MIIEAHTCARGILANLPKYPPFYICKEASTNPPLFMQNKPNFLNIQMNVTYDKTKDYENIYLLGSCKNKAKTNPIKPNQTQFH